MIVNPTANTLILQLIMKPAGKAFILMAVGDEAAIEVYRAIE
jgi:hypothetical protein